MNSVSSPIVFATLLLLLLLSVAVWSIALFKLWQRLQSGKMDRAYSDSFWQARNWQEAASLERQNRGDIARLAEAGYVELGSLSVASTDLKHQGEPYDVLERSLRQQLQNIQRQHERGLAELATIGSTAPFVGLFGTVWGIMHALQDIGHSGTASLDVVAGPVGEALIATAIGIATALPAVLAYNFFLRGMRVRMTELENFAHDFLRLAQRNQFRL